MAAPKIRLNLVKLAEDPLLFGTPVRKRIAAETVELAQQAKLASKPENYENTVARAARRPPVRINLAPSASIRVVGDPALFRATIRDAADATASPALKAAVERLGPPQSQGWQEVLAKYVEYFTTRQARRIASLKGLWNELSDRGLVEFEALLPRCAKKVASVGGWRGEILVIRGARSLGNGLQLGDYLIAVVDNPKNPQRIWVLAVVESKSKGNAIQIVSYKAFSGIPEWNVPAREGEFLGQPEFSVERMKEFGLDLSHATLEGEHDKSVLRKWKPDEIRVRHERGRDPAGQTTELIGAIPPDTEARDLDAIGNQARTKGIQVWKRLTTDDQTTQLVGDSLRRLDQSVGR
jgi:hypothetical protein